MTVRVKHDLPTLDIARCTQRVKFYPAGTGAVTGVTGKGCTVARTGVGTFTLTFADNDGLTYDYAKIHYNSDAVDVNLPEVGAYVAATGVLTVFNRNCTTGAAADVAADANRYFVVEVVWKQFTSVTAT